MSWGTPIAMLGRVGASSGCAACSSSGLGDPYAQALPAGSVAGGFTLGALPGGMGPQPWASYPGSGGPNRVVTDPDAPSPEWLRNSVTQPVISPDDPQNRQKVFNWGLYNPTFDPRFGSSIPGYGTAGLGALVRPWDGSASSFTMGVRGAQTRRLSGALRGCFATPVTWYSLAPTKYNILGAAVAGVHGYARNRKVGWALMWGAFGYLFPLFTNTIAIVQGLGKSKSG